jgi:hypothetical protein
MAKTMVEMYHWFRVYYLGKYGMPMDSLDLLYRMMTIHIEMIIETVHQGYTARYPEYSKMSPRERYLNQLRKELG